MQALTAGTMAPDFTLNTTDGKAVHLQELLQHGPVVLAFFKVSCPVCQFAFPMYERLAQAHEGPVITVLGICQNGATEAKAFAREYGVSFPVMLDNDANYYAVSNAYRITNVPTVFYIAQSGEIEVSSVGWDKADIGEVNAKLSELGHEKPPALWHPGEDVPAFRAG
jgi:peroxiredoxin